MWPIENQARSLKACGNFAARILNLPSRIWEKNFGGTRQSGGAMDVTFSVDVCEIFFCLIPSPYEKVMAVLLNPCRVRVFFQATLAEIDLFKVLQAIGSQDEQGWQRWQGN